MIKINRLDEHHDVQQFSESAKNINERIVINKLNKGISYFRNNTRLFKTEEALIMYEKGFSPVIYVPKFDIFQRHFLPSRRTSYCPFKGEANYWSLSVAEGIIVDAAWEYVTPLKSIDVIENHVAFSNEEIGSEFLFFEL